MTARKRSWAVLRRGAVRGAGAGKGCLEKVRRNASKWAALPPLIHEKQMKAQLERLLRLPPESLTKEIRLTQDLTELFLHCQIPADLLTAGPILAGEAAGGAGVGCSATGVESVFGVDAAFSPPQAASKSVAASAAREKRVCNMKSSRKRGGGTPQLDGPAELGDIPESTS